MKITFLGQAGLLFENNNSKIVIDPYLSDSLALEQPAKARRQPIDERIFSVRPTAIAVTHCHADHYDRQTLRRFFSEGRGIAVLSPVSVWKDVRTLSEGNNYILMRAGTSVSLGGMRLHAVRAEHSDEAAVGYVVEDREENAFYYVTGDTLYSEDVFSSLPHVPLKAVFLPVNGEGNNMNMEDAARFFARTRAKYAVPLHFGMFDSIDPSRWEVAEKVIPKIYEEVVLQ